MQCFRSGFRFLQKQRDFLNQTGNGFSGFSVLGRNSSSVKYGIFQSMPELQPNFGFRKDMSIPFTHRCMTTTANSASQEPSMPDSSVGRIKFKRLDKTARNIMQILDKEAVEEVRAQRDIPDIRPGNIVELKVEVPENKRRVSVIKGIVIARRNAGLNSTFRIRRLVAGVGVESLFPLYSPNIKEIKIVDRKKVRRAKLYYLRDKMNALKKH